MPPPTLTVIDGGGALSLVDLVRRYGVGAKLKNTVILERRWRRADHLSGDEGEWYARWPTFSLELEAAIREARR